MTHDGSLCACEDCNPAHGIFFCENDGTTLYVNVTYAEKPTQPCPTCGFTQWIFEPTREEVAE